MTQNAAMKSGPELVWNRYRDNSCRHLLGIAHYLQTSMMNTLQVQCGHDHLRLGFTPYISLIGERGRRLTEIAGVLGISRQACNQAVKPIEKAGYIARSADPSDGRAKELFLTPQGVKLRRDGMRIATRLDKEFCRLAGIEAITDASQALGRIFRHLGLGLKQQDTPPAGDIGMGALLPALSDYVMHRLMELTRQKGHRGLKLSFGQVLTLIGPSGGRIQQIAAIHDVSKQAISAIATELEELGYLRRETDPTDARQVVLRFTPRGDQLIADSVSSVVELEAEFAAIVGQAALRRMNATLRQLYLGLQLEQDIFENSSAADIDQLAQQLQQQLGEHGSQILARLLLNNKTR
jgi:DNA-binding MarR family transcriptional regulator